MPSPKAKQVVNISVLPGEPTNGAGRVCIHLFVHDERGDIVQPYAMHPAVNEDGEIIRGKLTTRPTRGRLACRKKLPPRTDRTGAINLTIRTDDPRAVTCPKCIESVEYKEKMRVLKEGAS